VTATVADDLPPRDPPAVPALRVHIPATRWTDYLRLTMLLFWAVHIAAVAGVIYLGWSWRGAALAIAAYFVRMVVVTAGYHRYFAHRAYKTSRAFQLILAIASQSAAQRGVLWWASHHRWHHKHSDTENDIHSVKQRGFWYSHLGWIAGPTWNDTHMELVGDLAKFPELRWLNRGNVPVLPVVGLALAFLFLGGLHGLVWGFFVSSVLVWHGSFAINSLSHLIGRRRFETSDDSRNSLALALLTTGEGWHNNHHRYQSSARQGFRWWEIDVTFYVLKLLAAVGLVWDLRGVPAHLTGKAPMTQTSAPSSEPPPVTLQGA
jgi:stearoyl-CoA desaturase (delta-9 desaturase)